MVTLLAIVTLVAASPTAPAAAQDATEFPELTAGQRVYDETGTSLTSEQIADLEQRLEALEQVGADAIAYVRALDATPEETLDQVEALQQAWVAETGADQDNAVAILINRNPDDQTDARAGIFVGSTFDDGNVPSSEQEAIVNEALIPPLRDGDVYASLVAGIERLETSIVEGPPQGAFEQWASDAGGSWVPWAGLAAALAGLVSAILLFQRRETIDRKDPPPTTARPNDELPPAVAGALVSGGPQASAVPATMLDLAYRDALAIEPESEGGTFSKPKVQIRLIDRKLVRNDIESALWQKLEQNAADGIVSSKGLQKTAGDSASVRKAVEQQLLERGWLDPDAGRSKAPFMGLFIVTVMLAIASFVIAAAGGVWLPAIGIVALAGVAATVLVMFSIYPTHTPAGQEAALPWRAYRDGLKEAARDETVALDLDATLADTVAMNLGSKMEDRLKQAQEEGQTLRAFTSQSGASLTAYDAATFPYWIAFSSTVATSSGAAASTVSGAGAGGGGGAAGST